MGGAYLHIYTGDSYAFSTNIAVDGVAQNLAGANLSFFALANLDTDGSEVLFTANTNTGQLTVTGNNSNVVTANFNSAFTANIPEANVAHWFLRTTTAAGMTYTLDRGRIAVVAGLPELPL